MNEEDRRQIESLILDYVILPDGTLAWIDEGQVKKGTPQDFAISLIDDLEGERSKLKNPPLAPPDKWHDAP